MSEYFLPGKLRYAGRKPTNLPSVLAEDLASIKTRIDRDHNYHIQHGRELRNQKDLDALIELAQDREAWKDLINTADDEIGQGEFRGS